MRQPVRLFSVATLAVTLVCAPPALALDEARQTASIEQHEALWTRIEEGFRKDALSETEMQEGYDIFLNVAADARQAMVTYADTPELAQNFANDLGIALFYAARYRGVNFTETESRTHQIALLQEALGPLDTLVAAKGALDGPSYELREAARQLFDLGAYAGDSRWADWSAANVRGSRATLARLGDADASETVLERNYLAQALYRHGHLTGDAEATAEARQMAEQLGEDRDYLTDRMHDAVAEGEAPYPATGEEPW
ncbi:hypothetical protein SZ64_07465 [Erythrobacter sp. SG61-1L]|uniref:hypothetical protein n=1 Tax=Erythrobacter sp. SG61-1L TaxID=1603897 RepID=UPI0006C92374|nr:hypothetical protein [Erythrobacter sp. SG61-1L]KPL67970.1 hypothetical protein SZ64_07465 [Erythrobacter sp. SG61-1L]